MYNDCHMFLYTVYMCLIFTYLLFRVASAVLTVFYVF